MKTRLSAAREHKHQHQLIKRREDCFYMRLFLQSILSDWLGVCGQLISHNQIIGTGLM